MMKNCKFILIILLSFIFYNVIGQEDIRVQNVKGSVVDAATREKLAFVNIVINEDGTLGTTTDIDGNFSINTKKDINTLTFSFVGYEKKTINIEDGNDIHVKLKPLTINLSEVVIDGSNDPANRIIDSVFKYRDSNNPKSQSSYHYKMYDNMVFTMDTSLLIFDEIRETLRHNDILAIETVSEQYYKKPNKSKKIILANKFSGSKNPIFVYMLENIQSVGFYDDLISIDAKKYVNPISKGSKNKYIFVLESSFKDENNDSIFTISFRPYRNTNFNSLKGTLTINSDNWAIQNIKAKPAKKDGMLNIEIQQLYEKVDGKYWFPKQINTIIATFDRENTKVDTIMTSDTTAYVALSLGGEVTSSVPILGIGKSYITDIEINKEIDKKIFDNSNYTINANAANNDDVIQYYRYDTLSKERLEATYQFVDSIFQESGLDLDNISNILASTISSQIPISIINLDLNSIMNYNIGNGYMLGLGLSTNNRVSKVFSIGGFANYWFKAKEANYGGNLTLNILRSIDMKLRIDASHKFERLGNYGSEEKASMLNSSNYKRFYINATSLNNSASANLSTYFNKHLKGFVNFEVADKMVLNGYQLSNISSQPYRLSTLDLKLRIAFGEQFIKSSEGLQVEGNANPVIWLSYQKNLKDVFGSPYNFDKIEFLFRGKKDSKYIGETSLTAQAGYINGFAPITELFNLEGSHWNRFDVYCTESFSTMRPDEFMCDRFGALYLSHNFKNLLLNYKKFHPEIILVTNIAFGKRNSDSGFQVLRFSDSQIFTDSQIYKDLSKGYFESGIVIDRIIHAGISKIGLGAFYRYGAYSYDNVWDNFVFKICMGFSL